MGTFLRDLGYALGKFRSARAFTATAVLTLAVGIGGTTAIFTLIHAVMLKSLPVGDPSRLYRIGDGDNILARLHRPNIIRDVFGGANPIPAVLRKFKVEGCGVLVYLRDGAAGVPTHEIPQAGATSSEAVRSRQWREIGLGAQILKDLGISSIRLITSRKLSYVGLAGFGIEIKDIVPLEG